MQQETQAELKRFHGDTQYFDSHYQDFLNEYPEQWVAVYNQEVVGTGPQVRPLLKQLKANGVPLAKVVIERVSQEQETWMFAAA